MFTARTAKEVEMDLQTLWLRAQMNQLALPTLDYAVELFLEKLISAKLIAHGALKQWVESVANVD